MVEEGAIRLVDLGRIVGVHGLAGWIKIYSFTEPKGAIFDYGPLLLGGETVDDFEGKAHGKGLLMRIAGRERREDVEALVGRVISVPRSRLPETVPGEFYHVDLVGLEVVNTKGEALGTVERVVPGTANDALVVRNGEERLIPFTFGRAVVDVDLEARRMIVEWEIDW
ncbi:MAG: ribosome maturation factor RimM [Pseudomonadota bacterium]